MTLITSLWFSASASRLLLLYLLGLAHLTLLASPYPICAGMDPSRVRCLNHSGARLAECEDLVSSEDVAAAFQKLGDILVESAQEARCKHVTGSRPSRHQRRDKPYLDHECRQMRAQFRYAMRHDPQHVWVLARRLSFTIRRKCRQYRQRQTPALLRHLRSNHKCFLAAAQSS